MPNANAFTFLLIPKRADVYWQLVLWYSVDFLHRFERYHKN